MAIYEVMLSPGLAWAPLLRVRTGVCAPTFLPLLQKGEAESKMHEKYHEKYFQLGASLSTAEEMVKKCIRVPKSLSVIFDRL